MAPEIARTKPAWEQIHDEIARQIAEGYLTRGQLVPSARDLAREWNVSVGTANRALASLVTARLVTRNNAGTFVTYARLVSGPQARRRQAEWPPGEIIRVTGAAHLERAPSYIWPVLDLDTVRDMAPVVRREELRSDRSGRPVSLTVEWVHPRYLEACPELAVPETLPFPGGALALIEARTGDHPVRGSESYESRPPQEDREPGGSEYLLLQLSQPGASVLGHVVVWYDARDRAMAYAEMTVISERVIRTEFTV